MWTNQKTRTLLTKKMTIHSAKYANLKQAIVVRHDLNMPRGKLAAQVSHASVEAALKSDKAIVDAWQKQGMKKIVLRAESLDELLELKKKASTNSLKSALIKDAGHTVLEPGTVTCLGIGPDSEDRIDKVTGHLKTE